MSAVLADLSIEARWIVPMNARGRVLESHTLVVRDGRILDLLPRAQAAERYAATVAVQRPAHLLMPGMVNAHTRAAMTLFRGQSSPTAALEAGFVGPEFVRDGVLAAMAEMLRSGITCFGDRYHYPEETARAAAEQGMRAVIGLPVADTAGPSAGTAAEYLTAGLQVRDEYTSHPLISTVFAPYAPDKVCDATYARVATLADELDAGIVIDLHESADAIARSVAEHGVRPLERLWRLGLLTPALHAVHMTYAGAADIELAQRTGIAVSLCSSSSVQREQQLPPAAAWAASGIRMGLGSGGGVCRNQDLGGEMRLLALMLSRPAGEPRHAAWDALAAATRGGAAVLGLETGAGTLEAGKWADLCCVDLGGPAMQPLCDPVTQSVFGGGRDMVSDVWVAGRQLLSGGELTRLDWPKAAARADAWAMKLKSGVMTRA
jgi:5-methylthioadenosine/S-adenosylhomocysteine deaminase